MSDKIKNAALEYLDWGFCVLPVEAGTKKPRINWKKYQEQMPTEEDIEKWFTQWPNDQLALVTGRISGIGVIDIDGPQGTAWAKKNLERPTVWQKTTKGSHLFYKLNGEPLGNNIRIVDEVDIKGEGGIVLIEPSIHPVSKKPYQIKFAPNCDWTDLTPFPYDKIPQADRIEKPPVTLEPTGDGSRNNTLARIAGKYFRKGMEFSEVLTLCKGWNLDLEHPLEIKEVETTVESIWKKHTTHTTNPTDTTNPTNSTLSDNFRQSSDSIRQLSQQLNRYPGNIYDDVGKLLSMFQGIFTNEQVYRELDIKHRYDKQEVSRALRKKEEEKIIKKEGDRNGCWRTITRKEKKIDIKGTIPGHCKVHLPLYLSEMVRIPEGSLALVAGAPNAGKTALLLEIIRLNLKNPNPILHLVSEAPGEVIGRVQTLCTEKELDLWAEKVVTLTLEEAGGDYADFIKSTSYGDFSNGLIVIDYLEEKDGEAYKMVHQIAAIRNEISTGKGCVIASHQKDPQKEIGKGGFGVTEAARFYLTMDRLLELDRRGSLVSELRIQKAKISADKRNHNGKFLHVEIKSDGTEFIPLNDWGRHEGKISKFREACISQYLDNLRKGKDLVEEPPSYGEKIVCRIYTKTGTTEFLRQKTVKGWQTSFPNLNIEKELDSWLVDYIGKTDNWQPNGKWVYQIRGILKKKNDTAEKEDPPF